MLDRPQRESMKPARQQKRKVEAAKKVTPIDVRRESVLTTNTKALGHQDDLSRGMK